METDQVAFAYKKPKRENLTISFRFKSVVPNSMLKGQENSRFLPVYSIILVLNPKIDNYWLAWNR